MAARGASARTDRLAPRAKREPMRRMSLRVVVSSLLDDLRSSRGGEITTRGDMRRVPNGEPTARLPSPRAPPTPTEERWVCCGAGQGHDYRGVSPALSAPRARPRRSKPVPARVWLQ
eukprot:scaffold6690_cov68-Phaeocystis_antarctica.AAC.3